MRPLYFLRLIALSAALVLLPASAVLAEIPPHAPGAICNTPQGWCWAKPPGLPGSPCNCPVGDGSVQGTLG